MPPELSSVSVALTDMAIGARAIAPVAEPRATAVPDPDSAIAARAREPELPMVCPMVPDSAIGASASDPELVVGNAAVPDSCIGARPRKPEEVITCLPVPDMDIGDMAKEPDALMGAPTVTSRSTQ